MLDITSCYIRLAMLIIVSINRRWEYWNGLAQAPTG